jgi:hypothetical protein
MSGAAEDAARVPVDFVYNALASTSAGRRNNRIYAQNGGGTVVSVGQAYRNLMVGGVADTRVLVTDAGRNANDNLNRLWLQGKYTSTTAPTPIATGIEARLILAEARGGAEGIEILNALRTRASLPRLSAAEEANFAQTVLEERNRWLFLQGNRWFDLRLRNLPLTPAVGATYQQGASQPKGGTYGDQRCWPIPDVERMANPNFNG